MKTIIVAQRDVHVVRINFSHVEERWWWGGRGGMADISPGWGWWERDSSRRGGKIGVKSLRTEQVSVICSLRAWCQLYNRDLDSPHKRQNSFALHMLHGALQVNPGSAMTSRLGPGGQQDWVACVLLGRLIGEFPLNKLHLICLGTRAKFAFWGLILSTLSEYWEGPQPPKWAPGSLKNRLAPFFLFSSIEAF